MRETNGDLWEFWRAGYTVCVTTNGMVERGKATMGKGAAFRAAQLAKTLPDELAAKLNAHGNHVYHFPHHRMITFPTKHDWRKKSDIKLIEASCKRLMRLLDQTGIEVVYIPRPGAGNGWLNYEKEVKPVIEKLLDDRAIVVHPVGK